MMPIRLNNKDFKPLEEQPYQYILAANGLFLAKENRVFRAVVKVEPGPELGLLPLQETIELKAIRIPFAWVYRAVQFFRAVYKAHVTEAFLWVVLDPQTNSVSLACPKQKNYVGHVHAEEDPEIPDDLLKIGDIHSHLCGSFHSSGDVEDEKFGDGIHIVVGNLDAPVPDFTASLVVKGCRRRLEPGQVMELEFGFDHGWMRKIQPDKKTLFSQLWSRR